ncbi:unnamed protein product [Linum trigynum]|uniref:Uncharacterized protein n=1 Tax=Linum trigynum TaxID=586398 RepID=A0AAV2EVI8_9ROSI
MSCYRRKDLGLKSDYFFEIKFSSGLVLENREISYQMMKIIRSRSSLSIHEDVLIMKMVLQFVNFHGIRDGGGSNLVAAVESPMLGKMESSKLLGCPTTNLCFLLHCKSRVKRGLSLVSPSIRR